MHYELPLLPATFLKREKRFSVLARLSDGREVWCHCPNPGRLTSCLDRPGIPLFLSPLATDKNGRSRKARRCEEGTARQNMTGRSPEKAIPSGRASKSAAHTATPLLRAFVRARR